MSKKRIAWLDLTRALAILLVVLCHSAETVYSLSKEGVALMSLPSEMVAFGAFTLGRLSVPLFLFMSGYLLLDREYDGDACRRFWRVKWLGLLIATEAWIVLYDIFLGVMGINSFTLEDLVRDMLFLQSVKMGHFWYMPMILGLYLFIPLMANALRSVSFSTLRFPLGVAIIFLFIPPVASVVVQASGGDPVQSILSPGFSGGVYGMYMILGLAVKRGVFKNVPSPILIALFAGFTASVVFEQIQAYASGVRYNVWYTDGLLLSASLCLFVLLSRMHRAPDISWIRSLSKYSFAIYLVHFPVKMMAYPLIDSIFVFSGSGPVKILILTIVVLAISWFLSWVINKIPVVGARLLYMR